MVTPEVIAYLTTDSSQLPNECNFSESDYLGNYCLVKTYNKLCLNLVTLSVNKLFVAYGRAFDWRVVKCLSYPSLPLLTFKVTVVSRTYPTNMQRLGIEVWGFIDMSHNLLDLLFT
jgi:hypothetical protein